MSDRCLQELYVSIIRNGREPVLSADVLKVFNDKTKASLECPIADLPKIFKESTVVKKEVQRVHVGEVPTGYYDAVISQDDDRLSGKVILIIEQSKRILQCNEIDDDNKKHVKRYIVPIPKLVLYFEIGSNYIVETKVFALKAKIIKEETRLYKYPFSNVNHDGDLCWGSVQKPSVNRLKVLDQVVRAFFESVNNLDNYSKDRTTLQHDTLSGLLGKLDQEEVFPNEILCKNDGRYKTMDDLLKKLRRD